MLRDQAAGPTLKGIGADRQRVCEALQPALEVIERRLFDPGLDVNAVWRESGLPKKNTVLFKAQVGQTPWKYIGTCRVEVAAKLLAGTEIRVTTIAEAVGYPSTTNTFSETFKSRFGLLPSEYREAVKARRDGETLEELSAWLDQVGMASAAGDFEGANQVIGRVSAAVREQEIEDLASNLALACHERGAQRTLEGDVDRAYDDLVFARGCYGQAGDLEPRRLRRRRHLGISYMTDEALTSELCPDCRTKLAGHEGRTLRAALRQALRLVPRDLEWFESCCDDCYRVVWKAISRARAGLMDDAWKAWWISTHADLADRETPPSRGRVIAALTEVERLVSGDQLERKGFCDLAVSDAEALGDPLLEAQARIWRASVLRAMGEFTDARAELNRTAEASRAAMWLAALHHRMAGILETNRNHWHKALDLLRLAAGVYQPLDPHLSGLMLTDQANVQILLAEYEEAVARNQDALSWLDGRRDPFVMNGVVPINSSVALALLGKWEKAESTLSRCRFQREVHPGLAATEMFTRACLELLRGRFRESLSHFADVKERFERIHRPLYVAVAASYCIEACARLGDRRGAYENAVAAITSFQAAGCRQDTLDALGKVQALLKAEAVDVLAVAVGARTLARQNGGWLPDLEPA